MSNSDHEFHIVVFPGATTRPRRFSIKRRTVRMLLVTGLLVAVMQALFLFQYVTQSGDVWELEALRSESLQHRQQAGMLSSAQEDLRKQLSAMREMNTRIRVMLGLDPPKESSSPLGLGGREESRVATQPPGLGGEREAFALPAAQLQREVAWLKEEALLQEQHLNELHTIAGARKAQWAATPSIWPVRGWVSSGFGRRVSPFTGQDTMHGGVDITAPIRTPVIAPAAGAVVFAGREAGLGNAITLSHGYGLRTIYGHMDALRARTGQLVKRGDVIGWVGNTGLSTGPHLHYEVEVKGTNVDPLSYIID